MPDQIDEAGGKLMARRLESEAKVSEPHLQQGSPISSRTNLLAPGGVGGYVTTIRQEPVFDKQWPNPECSGPER